MNGDTKNKWRGGIYGAAATALIAVTAFSFGYGILTNKVEALEKKVDCLQQINNRLATIENDIKWIKKHR